MSLLQALKSPVIFDFHGGIHPPEHKGQSNHKPIGTLPPCSQYVVPLRQHLGELGELLVKVGDRVDKGQPLSRPLSVMGVAVHAPTSGTVSAIEQRPLTHPSGLDDLAVVINADGEDRWAPCQGIEQPFDADPIELLNAVKAAGLAGMGGAGFPTGVKLGGSRPIEALLINAAECEPYITADDTLLREAAEQVVTGARLMARIVGAPLVVIGIEDNKPEAISALEAVLLGLDDVTLKVVPTKYPSGAERQLIKLLTGQEVPAGGIPADLGLVVQNVGTAYAAWRAICHGQPLIERVVTVTGQQVSRPGNYWLPIGTPISHVLSECGFQASKQQRLIIGGPMMGFTLHNPAAPISKTVNCLLLPNHKELSPAGREMACIRCGECANVCPAELLPQQLYWYAKAQDHDKLAEYQLSACIECGACAYVCPSQIPLVQYYRVAKSAIRQAEQDKRKSDKARERFEARKARLEREKAEREARHKEAAARRKAATAERQPNQDAVAAALARVKAKQNDAISAAQQQAASNAYQQGAEQLPDNSEMARLREERKALARQRKAEQQGSAPTEDKKAAVTAAIARAKAKKAEAADADASTDTAAGDKKAAVTAAIARAKAKKAEATDADASTDTAAGDKKAAVAAAIARAKAKKAEATGADASTDTVADDKRAAVAAAIARAKAKKAEAAGADATADNSAAKSDSAAPSQAATDDAAARKKAAIAAAVARAKAKKAQEGQD